MGDLVGLYNETLVVLSIALSVVASSIGLHLIRQVTKAQGARRRVIGTAFLIGILVWLVHFIGIQAFIPPVTATFHLGYVAASTMIAMFGAYIVLADLVHQPYQRLEWFRFLVSGTLFGLSLILMNYLSMAGMFQQFGLRLESMRFFAAILLAVGVVFASMRFALQLRDETSRVSKKWTLWGGLVMGTALSGITWTMASSVTFYAPQNAHAEFAFFTEQSSWQPFTFQIALLIALGFLPSLFDVKRFALQTVRLRENEQYYRSLFDHNPDAVFMLDSEGQFVSVNPVCEQVSGYRVEELMRMKFLRLIMPDDVKRALQNYGQSIKGESQHFEIAIRHKQGHRVDLYVTNVPILVDGRQVGVYGIARDITERKQAEEQINYMAYHDALTGLPNRRLFRDRLTDALARARRKGHLVGVMFIDLDRFKIINDSMGHAFGDLLLKHVAERLTNCVGGHGSVARMGGDEFTILLPDLHGADVAVQIVRDILESIRLPIVLEGQELQVTISIGCAFYPNDGEDVETLMRHADIAMYRAKEQGRNNYELYTPRMNDLVLERLAFENDLRKAIAAEEFVLYYQPQMSTSSGDVVGVEALVRWMHPRRGMVSPAQFIPLAEETGLIIPLGQWVLKTACAQNKAWQEVGFAPVRISVNLSMSQFKQQDLVEMIGKTLTETGLEPRYLELELTESIAMQNADKAFEKLNQLKAMGIGIAIDDFGTGYSSLSYLKKLPIHTLKIDKTFVHNLTIDVHDGAITSSIIAMAHNLKLNVIAEGVETDEQLDFLRMQNCDQIQGYLLSPPLPKEEFEQQVLYRTLRDRNEE